MTEADILNGILEREGGEYTDRANDRGGPTRWGVTMPALADFRGAAVTPAQVAALSRDEAYEVLEHLYIVRSGYRAIADERVRAMLCDWSVNASALRATRWLQRTLGVEPVDGVCGPKTAAAANALDGRALLKRLGLARQVFYLRTALQDQRLPDLPPSDLDNLEGWLARNWAVAVDPL